MHLHKEKEHSEKNPTLLYSPQRIDEVKEQDDQVEQVKEQDEQVEQVKEQDEQVEQVITTTTTTTTSRFGFPEIGTMDEEVAISGAQEEIAHHNDVQAQAQIQQVQMEEEEEEKKEECRPAWATCGMMAPVMKAPSFSSYPLQQVETEEKATPTPTPTTSRPCCDAPHHAHIQIHTPAPAELQAQLGILMDDDEEKVEKRIIFSNYFQKEKEERKKWDQWFDEQEKKYDEEERMKKYKAHQERTRAARRKRAFEIEQDLRTTLKRQFKFNANGCDHVVIRGENKGKQCQYRVVNKLLNLCTFHTKQHERQQQQQKKRRVNVDEEVVV